MSSEPWKWCSDSSPRYLALTRPSVPSLFFCREVSLSQTQNCSLAVRSQSRDVATLESPRPAVSPAILRLGAEPVTKKKNHHFWESPQIQTGCASLLPPSSPKGLIDYIFFPILCFLFVFWDWLLILPHGRARSTQTLIPG